MNLPRLPVLSKARALYRTNQRILLQTQIRRSEATAKSALAETSFRRAAHFPRQAYSTVVATQQGGPIPPDGLTEGERVVFEKLKEHLEPVELNVQDISGGCGSMYGLDIVSPHFRGLTTIKQHKLVNQVLGEEIKGWHGVQLKTRAPG
ncbi:MAG: hypothetical protein M1831_005087 [Alyxoria varia]|nr:MAG: hypothetical protein M1831_005087 [Alyxoria varia]